MALFRPLFSDGELVDVEVAAANQAWVATRSVEFRPGILGSLIHFEWEGVKADIRAAVELGHSSSLFTPSDTEKTKAHPTVSVAYRLLSNGYVVVEARTLRLAEEIAELTGPVLITCLPDGPGSIPTEFLAINDNFKNLFLGDAVQDLPSLTNVDMKSRFPLSRIREHVINAYKNDDWEDFFKKTTDAYLGVGPTQDIPFSIAGTGYYRSYATRQTESGEWLGIWIYRTATQQELLDAPEFQSARIQTLYNAVKDLGMPCAAHDPIFDDAGELVDMRAIWSNDAFNSYRAKPMLPGHLASESRVRFEDDLLPHLQRAWSEGSAVQIFRFRKTDDSAGIFDEDYAALEEQTGEPLEIESRFIRTADGLIMEWGEDMDLKLRFGSEVVAQRRKITNEISKARADLAAREEASRFSRELHDNILQELFILGMTLAPYEKSDGPQTPPDVIAAVRNSLEHITIDIRNLITGSKKLSGKTISDRLEEIAAQWNGSGKNVLYSEHTSVPSEMLDRLPYEVVENVTAITKEAVSNAVKHSTGDTVRIDLVIGKGVISVDVTDDGTGIDPTASRRSGMTNMRERADSIDAELVFHSSDSGLKVSVSATFRLEAI